MDISPPIFITGIPGSGSASLHERLAEDPQNRAPLVWEVMFPLPPQNIRPNGADPRIGKAEASLWWFRRLAPGADLDLRGFFARRGSWPHLPLAETLSPASAAWLSGQALGAEVSRPRVWAGHDSHCLSGRNHYSDAPRSGRCFEVSNSADLGPGSNVCSSNPTRSIGTQ